MLFAVQFIHRQFIADRHFRQLFVILFAVIVFVRALLIHAQKASKRQNLPRCTKHAFTHVNIYCGRIKFRVYHLTRHRALPNHLIELELVGRQKWLHAFRRTIHRSWADGFVCFLRVFGLGFVDFRRRWQKICANFIFNIMTDFG